MKTIVFDSSKHGAFFLIVLSLVLECTLFGYLFAHTARRDHFDFETRNHFKEIHAREIAKDKKVDELG